MSRRFDDPNDDTGRVASMIMERLLNNDIQENGEEFECTLKASLQDRLLPGLGVARVRYSIETKVDETGQEVMDTEDVPVDYYHWRDVAWGWGRKFTDLPWIAFRTWVKKDEVRERWGDEAAEGEGCVFCGVFAGPKLFYDGDEAGVEVDGVLEE